GALQLGASAVPVGGEEARVAKVVNEPQHQAAMPRTSCESESFPIALEGGHLVEIAFLESPNHQGTEQVLLQAVLTREFLCRADQRDPLAFSAEAAQRESLDAEGSGHDRHQLTLLGTFEHVFSGL